jgi:beta-N-acetylhexosaminidase
LLDGLAAARERGDWKADPGSEERRLALLPATPPTGWDDLMVQPRYMQALRMLP